VAIAKKKKLTKKPTKKLAKKPVAKAKKRAVKAKIKGLNASSSPSKVNWQKFIQPLQDRVVAIEIEPPTTTKSGLILPVDNEALKRARVVAAGLGRVTKKGKLRPLDVQVGDVILLTSFAGTKVTVANQEAIIVCEGDVLGIVSTPSL